MNYFHNVLMVGGRFDGKRLEVPSEMAPDIRLPYRAHMDQGMAGKDSLDSQVMDYELYHKTQLRLHNGHTYLGVLAGMTDQEALDKLIAAYPSEKTEEAI